MTDEVKPLNEEEEAYWRTLVALIEVARTGEIPTSLGLRSDTVGLAVGKIVDGLHAARAEEREAVAKWLEAGGDIRAATIVREGRHNMPQPSRGWGVWNVTKKEWLLAASMTEADAREATYQWNKRAQDDYRFEARRSETPRENAAGDRKKVIDALDRRDQIRAMLVDAVAYPAHEDHERRAKRIVDLLDRYLLAKLTLHDMGVEPW
jgi:hypothetical protein